MSTISFYKPKNINEWEAHKINLIQVFYTHSDFEGKLLLVKRSSTELELFFINASEDIVESFFVENEYEYLTEIFNDILNKGFIETFKNID